MASSPGVAAGERIWATLVRSQTGDSHLRRTIECQDDSAAAVARGRGGWTGSGPGTWAYLVVSDGHGSAAHFRSRDGAVFAVQALRQAFEELKSSLLDAATGTARPGDGPVPAPADSLHQHPWKASAPRYVVSAWRAKVHRHLLDRPPVDPDDEPGLARMLDQVRERHGYGELRRRLDQLAAFAEHARQQRGTGDEEPPPLPLPGDPAWDADALGTWQAEAYGATLLGALIGPEALYWFQLGDGAMVQVVGGQAVDLVAAPEEALANETPSLCTDDAVHAARAGAVPLVPGHVPSAVILTSDGVPNSFSETSGFVEFCEDIARRAHSRPERVAQRLPDWLTELSRKGSGDDMSLAMAWATEAAAPVRGTAGRILARDGAGPEDGDGADDSRHWAAAGDDPAAGTDEGSGALVPRGDDEATRRMRAARRPH